MSDTKWFLTILGIVLIFSLILVGCETIDGLKNKMKYPGVQPKCEQVHLEIEDGPILIFGDGLGEKKMAELIPVMKRTCKECHTAIYVGDVYPYGVFDEKDRREKVDLPFYNLGIRVMHAIGNHEYYGEPNLLVGRPYMPCHTFSAASDSVFIQVIDTNHPKAEEWPLCGSQRLRIIAGHHPLFSATTKDRAGDREELREKLYEKIRQCADLYVAGHDHNQQLISKDEMVFLISGGAGRSLTKVDRNYEGLRFAHDSSHGFAVLHPDFGIRFYGERGQLLAEAHFSK